VRRRPSQHVRWLYAVLLDDRPIAAPSPDPKGRDQSLVSRNPTRHHDVRHWITSFPLLHLCQQMAPRCPGVKEISPRREVRRVGRRCVIALPRLLAPLRSARQAPPRGRPCRIDDREAHRRSPRADGPGPRPCRPDKPSWFLPGLPPSTVASGRPAGVKARASCRIPGIGARSAAAARRGSRSNRIVICFPA
jgi:hypothetical protein